MVKQYDEPIGEWLKKNVSEDTQGTFKQVEINCPVSRSENLAMLVWGGLFAADVPYDNNNSLLAVTAQLTHRSQIAMLDPDDADIIWQWARKCSNVLDQGLNAYDEQCGWMNFSPRPWLIATEHIYLAVQSGISQPVIRSANIALLYTLEKVTQSQYIAALVPFV